MAKEEDMVWWYHHTIPPGYRQPMMRFDRRHNSSVFQRGRSTLMYNEGNRPPANIHALPTVAKDTVNPDIAATVWGRQPYGEQV